MGRFIKAELSNSTFKAAAQVGRYDKQTQDAIRNVIKAKTGEIYTKAVQLAPYDKGSLKSSIKMSMSNTATGVQGRVYTNDPVAHLIELGVRSSVVIPVRKKALKAGASGWFMAHAVIPYRSAKPFMQPAVDAVRPSIESAVKEAINSGGTSTI